MDSSVKVSKKCSTCKKVKFGEEFNKNSSNKDGLCYVCRECQKEYTKRTKKKRSKKRKNFYKNNRDRILKEQKEYYDKNREAKLEYQKEYGKERKEDKKEYDKIYYMKNKPRISKRNQKYYLDNKEKIDAKAKKYANDNPKRVKDTKRYGIYGITGEQYDAMFEKQGGRCKICKRHQDELKRKLSVDHVHDTNPIKIRGLLCDNCNHGIGKLQDDPEIMLRALEYVKKDGDIK